MRSRISIRGVSVRRSVGLSVHLSVTHELDFSEMVRIWTKQHQEHETMPFEIRFRDKYAGRSPERIWCLNSVRLHPGAASFLWTRGCRLFMWYTIFCIKRIEHKSPGVINHSYQTLRIFVWKFWPRRFSPSEWCLLKSRFRFPGSKFDAFPFYDEHTDTFIIFDIRNLQAIFSAIFVTFQTKWRWTKNRNAKNQGQHILHTDFVPTIHVHMDILYQHSTI